MNILLTKRKTMTNQRRKFIRSAIGLSAAVGTSTFWNTLQGKSLLDTLAAHQYTDANDLAQDETFWYQIQQAFTISPNVLNLNNGGVCPQPKSVQDAMFRYTELSNEAPSYYMWNILDQGREPLRSKLAALAGCSPEEIAIDRNSSEALETIIFGLPLQKGDEVVLTKQDYPNMINAWKQRELRDGIVLKWISLDLPSENIDQMVQAFVNAFTSKTKLVQITHIINWCGQILPVSQIALEAQKRGIEVLVDAAHTFAHIQYTIPELNCDYFGTSLHKWLCAPFGSGMLYVKKEKIHKIYPLLAAPDPKSEDIRKFEHLGTRSFPIEMAIGQAINFHHMIGSERKEARLHYLKNYWVEKCLPLKRFHCHTSLHKQFGCAIALFSIDGLTPAEVASRLFNEFKIHTVSIEWENLKGVRVTPNVYTTTKDLDRMVHAVSKIAS
jgi:selenocysteine lyase/cysteine desulfurase